MALGVIDLTTPEPEEPSQITETGAPNGFHLHKFTHEIDSSPEPGETPQKAAANALHVFQPRKDRKQGQEQRPIARKEVVLAQDVKNKADSSLWQENSGFGTNGLAPVRQSIESGSDEGMTGKTLHKALGNGVHPDHRRDRQQPSPILIDSDDSDASIEQAINGHDSTDSNDVEDTIVPPPSKRRKVNRAYILARLREPRSEIGSKKLSTWNHHLQRQAVDVRDSSQGPLESPTAGTKRVKSLAQRSLEVPSPASRFANVWTADEDRLLEELRTAGVLSWAETLRHFPGRTLTAIRQRWSNKFASMALTKDADTSRLTSQLSLSREDLSQNNKFGTMWTAEEDHLLTQLRETKKLPWAEMAPHFPGRTQASIQTRYSSKLARRAPMKDGQISPGQRAGEDVNHEHTDPSSQNVDLGGTTAPAREDRPRRRDTARPAPDGFVSWANLMRPRLKQQRQSLPVETTVIDGAQVERHDEGSTELSRRPPEDHRASLSQMLRHRELGLSATGSNYAQTGVLNDLKTRILDDIGPRHYFEGTSGDVVTLAWTPDGRRFAAGSIAISDDRSMQYNRPYNLVLGDHELGFLRELPEHHVSRPIIENNDDQNPNALKSMRETQDPRLFMTVSNVQFSTDGSTLYTAGRDCKVRAYEVASEAVDTVLSYEIDHPAPVDLMTINASNMVATGCHQAADGSIGVFQSGKQLLSLSPNHANLDTQHSIFPSALRWGATSQHSNLLLAGFFADSADEDRQLAGETCLWDVRTNQEIEVKAHTPNVFDVSWNPSASSASTVFAVASACGHNPVNRGMRSIIQCFAPRQNRASRVLEFQCPAFDINDVLYCPHDDNLIAAGATNGTVYIWDKRYAKSSTSPLHTFFHGASLNVLDHDRDRESADTGVRFLSWGATSSRLYSGSSDGILKLWNPYYASKDAHIKDVAAFASAIMSGAFSPDHRSLLIGEDKGRINSLGVDYEHATVRTKTVSPDKPTLVDRLRYDAKWSMADWASDPVQVKATPRETNVATPLRRFNLLQAPAPAVEEAESAHAIARRLVDTEQVVLRPMGALPIRQAVRGPNYQGPYLKPSISEWAQVQDLYRTACKERDAIISRQQSLQTAIPGYQYHTAVAKVESQVATAREAMQRLERRAQDAAKLKKSAAAHQRALREAENKQAQIYDQLGHAVESCNLDCNYLPPNTDDSDGRVPDSRRSEGRIPWELHRSTDSNAAFAMTLSDLIEAGFTQKCTRCSAPAQAALKSSWPWVLCTKCQNTSKGLTASCRKCSTPIRPSTTECPNEGLCERCNFACFRCAQPALVSRNTSHVTCLECGVTWRADVLGYEVVEQRGIQVTADRKDELPEWKVDSEQAEHNDEEDDLQDIEEYYHSRWSVG